MKKFLTIMCCAFSILCLSACQNNVEPQQPKALKTMTVYFSFSGNTEAVAKSIATSAKSDIFALEAVNPYPQKQKPREKRVKKEFTGKLPALKSIPDLSGYDVVFVGYPIWYSKLPPVVTAFLKKAKLDGKKVAFFCTSGSSPISVTLDELKNLIPQTASWIGAKRLTSPQEAQEWISTLKLNQ